MLPMTGIKAEGTEVTALVDAEASTSFLQMDWSKRNTVEIYLSNDAYQVCTTMGQEERVS